MKQLISFLAIFCLPLSMANAAPPKSIDLSICVGCDPYGVRTTAEILKDGIKKTAKETLEPAKHCKNDDQCKFTTIDLCGQQHVIYSTFRANGVETAITTMGKALHRELLENWGGGCTMWESPPPVLKCVKKRCKNQPRW